MQKDAVSSLSHKVASLSAVSLQTHDQGLHDEAYMIDLTSAQMSISQKSKCVKTYQIEVLESKQKMNKNKIDGHER